MTTPKVTHIVHHADQNIDRNNRATIINHEKSKRGTALSVYQISGLALELSRQADGTIEAGQFEDNFAKAFELLTTYEQKLADLQNPDIQD